MGTINDLRTSIVITCPYCDAQLEVFDVEVSVTVHGHDIMRKSTEGVFGIKCDECGQEIKITAQLDIDVDKHN